MKNKEFMRNWTRTEMADKRAPAEQQVLRCEATQYKGVLAERPQATADALLLRVREVITFDPLQIRPGERSWQSWISPGKPISRRCEV